MSELAPYLPFLQALKPQSYAYKNIIGQDREWVQGDILYATSRDTLERLAKNTTATRYLSNTGTNNAPAWAQILLASGVSDYTGAASWTPVLTFATPGNLSVTYSVQLGRITKIGDRVFATAVIVTSGFTHTTASGDLQITGLTLPSITLANFAFSGKVSWEGITKANYTEVAARLPSNSQIIDFRASGSGQAIAAVGAADVPTGGTVTLRVELSYQTP